MTRSQRPLAPIHAAVRPIDLNLHEIQVTLGLPADAVAGGAVLALPAWTPGSYLIRDYARFLDRLTAVGPDGQPLVLEKLDKQRWRVPAAAGPVTVTYRLFCNDLTVRTNHVDDEHAHLVGAATFLYLEGAAPRPFRVTFPDWPADWRVATSLEADGDGFLAPDHDTLVDSPFELGTFRMHAFHLHGCDVRLAITGSHPGNEGRMLAGIRAVVDAAAGIFGGLPMPGYLFLLTFSPGARGGLEHRNSVSMLADPLRLDQPQGYWELFLLAAHEFFHAWNVKRMHDPRLGPFDYQREVPIRQLWFHEGFTEFMQFPIVLRAGVAPWSWVAQKLGELWTDNVNRAGRLEQSLEESSFDAWIRHYKPTEFSQNSTVSYYARGAMVGWMMDAELRLASAGRYGLDGLFAHLWRRCGDGPVADADLRAAYRELAGREPAPFWERWIQGCGELDASAIERAYGLRFRALAPWERLAGAAAQDPDAERRARSWAGVTFTGDGTTVANVVPDSPAARGGLSYGMEVLAVDGWRTATAAEVQRRLGDRGAGEPVEVLAAHRGRVRTCRLVLGVCPFRTTCVEADPEATPAQQAAFSAWTGQDHPHSGRPDPRP